MGFSAFKIVSRTQSVSLLIICLEFFVVHFMRSQAPTWNSLGPGLYGPVYEITISGNDVYVGGSFLDAGGNPDADYIASWDGCQWHAVCPGLNGEVRAITVSGNDIYVGGNFSLPFLYLARWDGDQWNSMGTVPGDIVNTILKVNGNVVVGGGTFISGFVAEWNGNTWTSLGPVFNRSVNDIVSIEGVLYAGGGFANVGGNPNADGVIKWENGTWVNLGLGINAGMFTYGAFDLLDVNNELFVGGNFISAGGDPNANRVVKWDGENWINVGAGLPGFLGLHALTIFEGSLYTTVGAGWANDDGIYRWDFETATWEVFQIMGLGPDDPLLVLAAEDSNMYVAGFSGMIINGMDYAGPVRYGVAGSPGVVTSFADHGPGSLREIISCASNGETITFILPPLSEIILTSGEIIIDKDLTLAGPGINDLTISGNNTSRIFHLLSNKNLTIENMSLKNATSFLNGGAILNKWNLNLENVVLQNNFQNGTPLALTLSTGSQLTIMDWVEFK